MGPIVGWKQLYFEAKKLHFPRVLIVVVRFSKYVNLFCIDYGKLSISNRHSYVLQEFNILLSWVRLTLLATKWFCVRSLEAPKNKIQTRWKTGKNSESPWRVVHFWHFDFFYFNLAWSWRFSPNIQITVSAPIFFFFFWLFTHLEITGCRHASLQTHSWLRREKMWELHRWRGLDSLFHMNTTASFCQYAISLKVAFTLNCLVVIEIFCCIENVFGDAIKLALCMRNSVLVFEDVWRAEKGFVIEQISE